MKLPTKDVEIGSRAVVAGWGSTKDVNTPLWPNLQKLEMEIIDQKTCQEMMEKQAHIDQSHICTKLDKGFGTCTVRNPYFISLTQYNTNHHLLCNHIDEFSNRAGLKLFFNRLKSKQATLLYYL